MKILILDNYDSFTYNLFHLVKKLGYNDLEVHRNDKIPLGDVSRFDKIILSPGPGIPSESGILLDVIRKYSAVKSIFGVCLGMQAIAEAFGGKLINLPNVYHGVSTQISVIEQDKIFAGLGDTLEVGRYHSWAAEKSSLPKCLTVTSQDADRIIMSLKHNEFDVYGVQFHPESVLTPKGERILENWFLNK